MAPFTRLFSALLLATPIAATAVVKDYLLDNVFSTAITNNLEDTFLDAPSYTMVEWDLPVGYYISTNTWKSALSDKTYDRYCGENITIYNVTYSDCDSAFVVGYCSQGQASLETVIETFGKVPSNLRAAVSDLLYNKGATSMGSDGDSVDFAGDCYVIDLIEGAIRAMMAGQFQYSDTWMNAVNADSCVTDKDSAGDLNRDSPDYQTSAIRGGTFVAYNVYTGEWPEDVDVTCMSNQIQAFQDSFEERWSTEGECVEKASPTVARGWDTLVSDFSGFTGSIQPAIPEYTYVKWDTGIYPQFCYNAGTAQSNGAAVCAVENIEVYNVTYSDCEGYDPWAVCRCSDAQLSTTSMLDKFGQVPPGVRSYVVHMMTVYATTCSGGSSNDRFKISGNCTDREYMHESMHSADQNFHLSATFEAAYNADTCVPDSYSKSSWAEDFAQLGVWTSYDINGNQDVGEYLGVSESCMANQLAAVKSYAGTIINQSTSTCSTRRANDANVNASGQQVASNGARINSINSAASTSSSIQWDFEDYFEEGLSKTNGTRNVGIDDPRLRPSNSTSNSKSSV